MPKAAYSRSPARTTRLRVRVTSRSPSCQRALTARPLPHDGVVAGVTHDGARQRCCAGGTGKLTLTCAPEWGRQEKCQPSISQASMRVTTGKPMGNGPVRSHGSMEGGRKFAQPTGKLPRRRTVTRSGCGPRSTRPQPHGHELGRRELRVGGGAAVASRRHRSCRGATWFICSVPRGARSKPRDMATTGKPC